MAKVGSRIAQREPPFWADNWKTRTMLFERTSTFFLFNLKFKKSSWDENVTFYFI